MGKHVETERRADWAKRQGEIHMRQWRALMTLPVFPAAPVCDEAAEGMCDHGGRGKHVNYRGKHVNYFPVYPNLSEVSDCMDENCRRDSHDHTARDGYYSD